MKINFHKQNHMPEHDDGIAINYAPAKRRFPKVKWYLILLVLSSPLIYFLANLILGFFTVKAHGLVSLELTEVRSTQAGVLLDVEANMNDFVTNGSKLAAIRLPDRMKLQVENENSFQQKNQANQIEQITFDYQQNRKKIEREVKLIQLNLTTQETLLKLRKNQLNHHNNRMKNMRFLFSEGAASLAEMEQTRAKQSEAKINLYIISGEFAAEKAKLLASEDRLNQLNDEYMLAKNQINQHSKPSEFPILAPVAGQIIEKIYTDDVYVSAGDILFVIAKSSEPKIYAYLDPKLNGYAQLGTKALIKFPDGQALQAEVIHLPLATKIRPQALNNAFGARPLSLVVGLKTIKPLPDHYRINHMPVEIKFNSKIKSLFGV